MSGKSNVSKQLHWTLAKTLFCTFDMFEEYAFNFQLHLNQSVCNTVGRFYANEIPSGVNKYEQCMRIWRGLRNKLKTHFTGKLLRMRWMCVFHTPELMMRLVYWKHWQNQWCNYITKLASILFLRWAEYSSPQKCWHEIYPQKRKSWALKYKVQIVIQIFTESIDPKCSAKTFANCQIYSIHLNGIMITVWILVNEVPGVLESCSSLKM